MGGVDGALRLQKGCVNLWVIASQASCHAAADSPKIARSFRDGRRNFDPLPMPQGPPRTCLRATIRWAQVARELCENMLPIALPLSFAG
jgi:hypothetical protein